MSKYYAFRNGTFEEIYRDTASSEPISAAVHQDTFKTPLRHPKTGEMVESLSRWNQINKQHNLRVVGNDELNCAPKGPKDRITDEKIMEAIYKAEAIHSNPDKLKEREHENMLRLEKAQARMRDEIRVQRIQDEAVMERFYDSRNRH